MFFRFFAFTFLWALVILSLILMPGSQMPGFINLFSFDKFAHLGVFAVLCFLMIVGFTKQSTYPKLKSHAIKYSLLICICYASVLELGQSLIPDRSSNFYDMAFNLSGVLLGYLLFLLVYKSSFIKGQFK